LPLNGLLVQLYLHVGGVLSVYNNTILSEVYNSLVTVRAHSWQNVIQLDLNEKLDRSQEPVYLRYIVKTWLQLTLCLVAAGLTVTVVGVAVAVRHTTSARRIGVASLNIVSLGENIQNLISV